MYNTNPSNPYNIYQPSIQTNPYNSSFNASSMPNYMYTTPSLTSSPQNYSNPYQNNPYITNSSYNSNYQSTSVQQPYYNSPQPLNSNNYQNNNVYNPGLSQLNNLDTQNQYHTSTSPNQLQPNTTTQEVLQQQNDQFLNQLRQLNLESKSRQDELKKRQTQVELKQRELEAQKRQLEDHQRMIAMTIERERAKLRQNKILRDKELAELESQIKNKQNLLNKKDSMQSRPKSEDDIQMKESLYSYIIETLKNLAKNANRILDLAYKNYSTIKNPSTDEHALYKHIINYFEGLIDNFKCTLEESILNIEDIDSVIGAPSRNLVHPSQALINASKKVFDRNITLSEQEFKNNIKQSVTAVIYSIKEFIEVLEQLKISEELAETSKILSVGIDEAEKIVDNALIEKNAQKPEYMRSEKKPLSLGTFDPKLIDISSYNIDKVKLIQSKLRNWNLIHRFRTIIEQWRKSKDSTSLRNRFKLLNEVVETERSYVHSLLLCREHFYLPFIENSKQRDAIITSSQIESLFGKFDKILEFSQSILKDMENRLSKWPSCQLFGDILVERSQDMLIYADYINNYDNAMATYATLHNNPKFNEFERKCVEKTKVRMDTPSFLIMPIQRLPRYQLLLRELVKYTDKDHVDYNNLIDANDAVTKINVEINKRKREFDNKMNIERIKREIQPITALNLDPSNQFFLKSTFASFKQKETITGCIYLFNNCLILGKSTKKNAPPPYTYIDTINFHEVDIVLKKRFIGKQSFKLLDKTGSKGNWTITFSSDDECQTWFNDLSESIETHSLRSLLDSKIVQEDSKDQLLILSATYGDLTKSHYCIDVSVQLQNMVKAQGGKTLTLPKGSKKHLPGFSDPVKGKKKNLLIVFSVSGFVKTRSYEDEDEVKLP